MKYKWWILAAMTSCISMIFIDITVLPVALPTIQRSLNMSDIGLQWIINAYTLALTVFVLAGGRLGDMLGHRRIFCWGVLLFAGASAMCGLSNGESWFIFSRVLQGIGGALLIPSTSAIIIDSFPLNQRGRAMGIYVSVGSVFLAMGPFVGGMFSQYLSWRYVFWMNLPIALIGFLLAMIFVPRSEKKRARFDLVGFLTFSAGITCVIVPLMQTQQWGWTSPLALFLLCTGLLCLTLLCFIDRKIEEPYFDFSLFRQKLFVGAQLAAFFTQFLVMVTVFWSIYLQNVLTFSPSETGLLNLIANSPIIIAAPLGGLLLDRFGPRTPLILGFTLIIGSLLWYSQIYDQKNIPLLLTAFIPFGCGVPMIFTPTITAVMTNVAPHKRGLASGMMMTLRQTGATLGLAIFGSIFIGIAHGRFSTALKQYPATDSLDPTAFSGLLAKAPSAMEAFNELPVDAMQIVQTHAVSASSAAFGSINLLAILMAVLGLVSTLWLIHGGRYKQT